MYTRIVRVMVRVLQILVSNFLVQDSMNVYFILLFYYSCGESLYLEGYFIGYGKIVERLLVI